MTQKKSVGKSKDTKPKKVTAKSERTQPSFPIVHNITDRDQAEGVLRTSVEGFRSVFDNGPLGMALVNKQYHFIRTNSTFCKMLGYTEQELYKLTFKNITHPDDMGDSIKIVQELENGNISTYKTEKRYITKNKAVIWGSLTISKNFDKDEEFQFYLVMIEDITDRKQTEMALRVSEEKYRGLVSEISEGIFVTDDRGALTYANLALARMMGLEYPDQMVGRNFMEFVVPPMLNKVAGYFRQAIKTGHTREAIIVEVVRADGTNAVVEVKSLPIMGNGKVLGTRGVLRDITERKQAEAERQALLEIMQGLVATNNLQEYLQLIHHSIAKVIYAENFFVVFLNKSTGFFEEVYAVDQHDAPMPPSKLGKSITAYVFRTGEPLLLTLASFEELVARGEVELVGTKLLSWLGAPLKTPNETIGVIVVQNYEDADCYSTHDRDFLASVGIQVSLAIERKQAEDALRKSESSLYAVLQSTADGILAVGSENEVLYANERFGEMWRIPQEVMASRDDSVLLKHVLDQLSDSQGFLKMVQELYKSDKDSFDTLDFKDGRVYERLSHPLMQGAKVQGRVWSFRDATVRKRAEEALKESQQSYQRLVERIPGVIYRDALDEKASTLFISPQIKDLTGYSPEEWQADPDLWLNILHPDDRARVMAENKHHYSTGEQFKSDYRLLARDGRIVWVRDEAVSIRDSSGQALYDQGVYTDITERKLSEEQLRLSEERYRMLAENMSDTVWLMDMSLRTTYISPSVTRLRGFTLDEINSIPLDRQMPPESLQRALQLFAETLSPDILSQPESLISRTIELEFFKKDGTKFWSENTFTVIRDSQRQPIAILGSGRDISERKNSESAIQNSEKYFRALIENNTDAVVLVDPRGRLLYESPQNARMLGRAPGQRLGKSGYDFIHPEDRGFVAQMLKELVQHPGEIRQTTFRNQHKDGSWRWIEATATNLLGESAIHGLVINMHDITERKQAEEEIRHRVADLEVLYENSLSLSVLLEPRKIAKNMVKVLSQKLDWHHATIQLVHPETRRLELLALNKPGLTPNQIQVEINRMNKIFSSPNQGLSGWVIKNGKTIRSGDVRTDKRHLSTFPEIRSGLYVPLMIGERAIGSIAVESRQENRFSEEDERLLQTLAVQSAIAFENARLYQDAVRAAKRKAALHQGSLEIGRAGQEIEALCIALHDAVQQVMPAEAFTVSLITEDGLEVEAPYLIDRGIRYPNTRQPLGVGITGRVIKSQKPLRLKDVQKTRGVKPILVSESEPTRSVLSVPLLVQNKIIGVISTQSFEPNVYTIEDQIFMETLASEAAVAFENARLFDEISRRLVELESLSQVSDSLTSAIDLQPLLENILTGARNAIPAAEKGTISLAEPDGVLRLHAVSGYKDPRLMGLLLANQKGYAARVALERIPLKIDDAQAGYEAPYISNIEEIDAVQSGIAAPLIVKGKVIGVISLDNASRKTAFIESDLRLLVTFASSVAVAIENARLFTETQQRLHRLSALHSIDAAIGASVDIKVTLNIVLEHVMTELRADAAAVLLFNPLTRMLEYTAGSGFRVHVIEGMRLRLGEGLAGQSVLQRRAINIADIRLAYEVEQVMEHPVSGSASVPLQYLEGENFVSYHAIPLIAKGQVQGVLEIFRRTPMKVDQEWITFFEMLAGQTALAIDNGRLFENLQHSNLELTLAYDATIQGWSQALELRDEETGGHTQRVTDLTLNLIQAMGLEEVEMEHARRGSLLHDIGKIAVPDSILLKPGPLDEHEWSVMHQHPQYAYNMLSPITYLAPAIHIPWCHHEKWDGSGYPRGLKGEAIPMVARIFAIVDVYDALTSNRPYRLAWTRDNAMEYIREQSGLHFDPKVVKAFMDLMADEK